MDCHESATFYKVAYSRNGSVRAIDSMQCADFCNDINCHKVVLTFRNDNKSPPPHLARGNTRLSPSLAEGGLRGWVDSSLQKTQSNSKQSTTFLSLRGSAKPQRSNPRIHKNRLLRFFQSHRNDDNFSFPLINLSWAGDSRS